MDTPGGNRGPTIVPIDGDLQGFSAWAPGASTPPAEVNQKQLGIDKFPLLSWWQYWCDGSTLWDAVLTGDPYPVRALWNESGNFMSQTNSTRAWEALCALDFYVDLNLWHTPSTDAADIILPVAHWIELNSPRASQGAAGAMGATVKCVQPPAEAKYDPEIVMDLARRMNWQWTNEPGNEWPDIQWQLDDSIKLLTDDELTYTTWHVENGVPTYERHGVPMAEVTPKYKTWDEYVAAFQEHGWWQAKDIEPRNWGTYRRYQTGALRARDRVWARLDYTAGKGIGDWKPGYFTPTMKQEIWSTVMETHHPDHREWWLPSWVEPPHGPKDGDRIKEYPLTATTGRRIPVYFHSEHRQLPWCRELWPVPRIEINPKTAAEYGIEQGDWVWIETEWGQDPRGCRPVLRRGRRRRQPRAHLVVPRGARRRTRLPALPGQPADRPPRARPAFRKLEPARLSGEDLQGDARELAVQQPGSVRQQRNADHPHLGRPPLEGMVAHLRRKGVGHVSDVHHHRREPVRRLSGLLGGLQGRQQRAHRQLLEQSRAHRAQPHP